jgi:hypothetical protein
MRQIALQFKGRGEKVYGIVQVYDELAIFSTYPNQMKAKELYDKESRNREIKVMWDDKKKVMTQLFPNLKEKEVLNTIKRELASVGVRITEQM